MKVVKFLIMFLSGVAALVLTSCQSETVEYRQSEKDGLDYVIKTQKGRRLWGMASLKSNAEVLPCQYDSIYSYMASYNQIFVVLKDGKKYALPTSIGFMVNGKKTYATMPEDKFLFGGRAFEEITPRGEAEHNQALIYNYNEAIFPEADGIIFFHYDHDDGWVQWGPAQKLFRAKRSILYQKNGKWSIYSEKLKKHISDFIYDGVIEVSGPNGEYWLVKQDGKWKAIDEDAQQLRNSNAHISRLLKLPIIPLKKYDSQKITGNVYQRVGSNEVGHIMFCSVSGMIEY